MVLATYIPPEDPRYSAVIDTDTAFDIPAQVRRFDTRLEALDWQDKKLTGDTFGAVVIRTHSGYEVTNRGRGSV